MPEMDGDMFFKNCAEETNSNLVYQLKYLYQLSNCVISRADLGFYLGGLSVPFVHICTRHSVVRQTFLVDVY